MDERINDMLDARLSRQLLESDFLRGSERLQQLGPFELAGESVHDWTPKLFTTSQGDPNLNPENQAGYSITNEVRWYAKIKPGHVPRSLLDNNIFALSSTLDKDGDPAFELVESPQYPVTIDQDLKRLCNIPVNADQFSFIYPVAPGVLRQDKIAAALAGPDREKVDANLELLTVGAFAYWRGKTAFPALALRPLRLAKVGLSFSLPRDLSLLDRSGQLAGKLKWHEITLEPLRQLGAHSFTWINPNRPDLLPHLNYFHVRADEDMALPPPGDCIALSNLHSIDGMRTRSQEPPLWQESSPVTLLQVEDEQGTRAKPQVVQALSKYNLRDPKNGHFYQLAEHGAFAYRMDDGSIRYFDILDSFARPLVADLAGNMKLRQDAKYQQVCNDLRQRVEVCRGVLAGGTPPAEWPAAATSWRMLSEALGAADAYERMLGEYYAKEADTASRLDAQQIACVSGARRDELLPLADLLAVPEGVSLRELGPMGLRSCGWRHDHLELSGRSTAAHEQLPGSSPESAADELERRVRSAELVPVRVTGVPSCLQLDWMKLEGLETCLSPISAVTLPMLSRIKAGIPLAATHFAFLYPVEDPRVHTLEAASSFSVAEHGNNLSLLTVGAFVYLDGCGRIVQDGLKTLKFGMQGLRFSPVRSLDAFVAASQGLAAVRAQELGQKPSDVQEQLAPSWRVVTAPSLQRMRVSHFLWMPPPSLEQPSSLPGLQRDVVRLADRSSGAPYVLGAHGLFAYKVVSEGREHTIYFDVLPDPSAALFAQLEQLEGFQSVGELISSMKRRLLGHEDSATQYSEVVNSQTLASCIKRESGRSAQAVSKMLAEYIRAIADLQNELCPVCTEAYSPRRPRACFRVCKHTTCWECEPKLQRCPLCNFERPPPKLAEDWLQMLDEPEKLAELLQSRDVNIAELWWQNPSQG